MERLKGKICHRLDVCKSSRKRPRSVRGDNDDNKKTDAGSRTIDLGSGLIFVPQDGGQYSEFVLSLPRHLQTLACEAAVFERDVVINRYTILPLSTSKDSSQLRSCKIAFLEVHDMQRTDETLQIASLLRENQYTYLTLAQLRCREESMNTVNRDQRHHILATVDAISPIIAIDPNKPFALVELYDSDSQENSCIVVLKSSQALACHSAIFPGDAVKFRNLCRKPWRVPQAFLENDSLCHLSARTPPYVFVAEDLNCVSMHNHPATFVLPSTPSPLVSTCGKICHLQTITVRRKGKQYTTMDWLEIRPSVETTPKVRLYVAHLPMSTSLRLSLRIGAEICASNVHTIQCPFQPDTAIHKYFGACLRSTITVLKHAKNGNSLMEDTTSLGSSKEPILNPNRPPRETLAESIRTFVPYNFCKIKHNYDHHLCGDAVKSFINQNFPATKKLLPAIDSVIDCLRSEVERAPVRFSNTPGSHSASVAETKEVNASLSDKVKHQKEHSIARDPYAEFFDHAFDNGNPNANSLNWKGCAMSRKESVEDVPSRLQFTGLHELRSVGLQLLCDKLVSRETSSGAAKIFVGWTASMHLSETDLLAATFQDEQQGKQNSDDALLFSGGVTTETNKNGPSALRDKHCCVPVSFSQSLSRQALVDDFVLGHIARVVVSCICIEHLFGTAPVDSNCEDDAENHECRCEAISLPASNALESGCSLIRVGRKLFVASIHIYCQKPISAKTAVTESPSLLADGTKEVFTIKDCLESPQDATKFADESTKVTGLLLGTRFAHSKIQSNGMCKGCVLKLSSIPLSKRRPTFRGDYLQSLDMRLSIPVDKGKLGQFKNSLKRIFPDISLSNDKLALGASWWILADSGSAAPIVGGGWDDRVEGSGAANMTVRISFPMVAVSVVKAGYVRVECRLEQIEANYKTSAARSERQCSSMRPAFDYECEERASLPGMVGRKTKRRLVLGPDCPRRIGEMTKTSFADVPTCNLVALFRRLCQSLAGQDSSRMSPQFVHQVVGSSFLGITFCQVHVQCTRCFKRLSRIYPSSNRGKKRVAGDESTEGPSFWHLPDPHARLDASSKRGNKNQQYKAQDCGMRCPNGCPSDAFEVLWECSGTIDDGTGQAKIYAERDMALTLLGMDAGTIHSIEEGVWHVESGSICFNKSIPPTRRLQETVQSAISAGHRRRQDPRKFLTPAIRAEYLLQYFCRNSNRPRRKLDYFVQCKPLADDIQHLKHTMFESWLQGNANGYFCIGDEVTYSLPPLKLRLVDCCVPTDDTIETYSTKLKEEQQWKHL